MSPTNAAGKRKHLDVPAGGPLEERRPQQDQGTHCQGMPAAGPRRDDDTDQHPADDRDGPRQEGQRAKEWEHDGDTGKGDRVPPGRKLEGEYG